MCAVSGKTISANVCVISERFDIILTLPLSHKVTFMTEIKVFFIKKEKFDALGLGRSEEIPSRDLLFLLTTHCRRCCDEHPEGSVAFVCKFILIVLLSLAYTTTIIPSVHSRTAVPSSSALPASTSLVCCRKLC